MSRSIWRRHLRGWLPPLLVFLVNLALFSVYGLVFAGEERAGGRLLDRREAEVGELRQRRRELADLVRRMQVTQQRLEEFRDQRLATEARRLTQVIAEVKELATRAGVKPSSISYPEVQLKQLGLSKRSFVFSVDGDYAALRRLINFLELSDHFLTLEQVSLSGRSGEAGGLRISLQISTLFLDPETVPAAAGASS